MLVFDPRRVIVTWTPAFLPHHPSKRSLAAWPSETSHNFFLYEVPLMQPRRQSTQETHKQLPELLVSIDADVEVELLTPLCQQTTPIPGCRWRCHLCSVSQVDHA